MLSEMKMKDSVHEKAIRLVEGGIVDINGHSVMLVKYPYIFDPCFCCDMGRFCHYGNEMCLVCEECDSISDMDCFLIPFESTDNKS